MQKYDITGMSCAACSARVEKAVSGLEGIQTCEVNLLTNSMMIEGDVDSSTVIDAVKKAGVKVVMLTGDNQLVAQKVGKAVGVDDVIAGVTPVQKEAAVRDYKKEGYVIMVGDGINDAPALVSADIGIPLAAGCFIKLFGWSLSPMFGAAAMSISSFCVVMNALRLRRIKLNAQKELTQKEGR